jgi:hypothetical protein
VLDADPGAGGDRSEPHVDLGLVDAAAVHQAAARFPHRDPAEFENVAGGVLLEDPPAHTGFDALADGAAEVPVVDRARHPPLADLFGEGPERGLRVDLDLHRRGR